MAAVFSGGCSSRRRERNEGGRRGALRRCHMIKAAIGDSGIGRV